MTTKIMRNALVDLDPPSRAVDEAENAHSIDDIVEKWRRDHYRLAGDEVRVEVRSQYRGGVSSCCLGISAVDRVLYNLVNNATRFAVDHRAGISILPWPEDSMRFVVANRVGPEQRAWIDEHTARPSDLFAASLTRGGRGLALANGASLAASAYGVAPPRQALDAGLLGATLAGPHFAAWFHRPRSGGPERRPSTPP